ncbi:MAG: acyl-CoA dehydrogenase, partial [Acaryochloridaceae cyanobacterium RU_4_10]|nr:acyl-CoA dehydrogenase [Acaryochloridaceae cyanobacterium RU_4_10]
VSIEQIIGGVSQAGQGWKMLMQSLAAGRGVSFPATCTGGAKLTARVTGAYAVARKQFGLSIGRFEGVEEPLARIGGLTYLMDGLRLYTCGAVDAGEQPAVVSAIAKYASTELSRKIVTDGMDILGGAGICRGPRNLLANIYTATPISITVEGANILTRTMMIFGQGAIRCHPYVYAEIDALDRSDVAAFDRVLWPHLGSMVRNAFRAVLLGLSRGRLARSPVRGPTAQYYRKLAWASATFAVLTDLAMFAFGGTLKRRETLTGRFADLLSWMYLGTATLRRFEAEGRQTADLPLVDWAMNYTFAQLQQAFEGLFNNLPIPGLKLIAGWWRLNPVGVIPSDDLGARVATLLQTPGAPRDRLTQGIYLPTHPDEALGRLEQAMMLTLQTKTLFKTIKTAIQQGKLPQAQPEHLIEAAVTAKIATREQAELMKEAAIARNEAIQVDSFSLADYQQGIPVEWNRETLRAIAQ